MGVLYVLYVFKPMYEPKDGIYLREDGPMDGSTDALQMVKT